MLRVARLAAWLLLMNGLLGLGAWLWIGLSSGFDRGLPHLAALVLMLAGVAIVAHAGRTRTDDRSAR